MGDRSCTCARCGKEVEGEGLCGECAAQPEASPQKKISDLIECAKKEIERGKRKGVALGNAEELLEGVMLMLEAENADDALRLLNECLEFASERIMQHEMLVAGIKRAEMRIKEAEERGLDTTEAATLLKMAQGALDSAEYREGIDYARKGAEAAQKGRKKDVRVEVAAWQRE
ncbi:MAG: hypothetical protein HZB92_08260 [Euryarchaeota archaeon]|nr:hypothetical protein [Euryarchaeota archaeon]